MPRQSSSLPPYLTSGASSRAHHGLLARLHEASSVQEADEIISGEIKRAKKVLAIRGQSTSKISETLIILLHCQSLRHRTDEDTEFALVPALQLAEGGRSLVERRIGYLYLVERLPKGHELNLLLINTIRKDLSSTSPPCILLALQTITKIPSPDLAPAVLPLLTSRTLLKHKSPAVRQRTFEALLTLHRLAQANEPFPLSINKLLRSLQQENDQTVLAVILRLVRHVLESGAHHVESDEERLYIIDKCLEAARRSEIAYQGQIAVELVRTIGAVLEGESDMQSDASIMISRWAKDVLSETDFEPAGIGAFLLEISHLAARLRTIAPSILRHIAKILSPSEHTASSSTSPQLPSPNNRVLALRCLSTLPLDLWDGLLDEEEMGAIMQGVHSVDDTIRKLTLQLLQTLSPDLPAMILQSHLESIKSSTDLSLPASLADSLTIDEKTKIGRYETASRAIEVVEAQYREDGEGYARGVVDVLTALDQGHQSQGGQVWDIGARRVLSFLENASQSFARSFAISLIETLRDKPSNPGETLAVILTSTSCELFPFESDDMVTRTIDYLLRILPKYNASIQELVLVTLVALLLRLRHAAAVESASKVLEAIQGIQEGSSRYLKNRCQEVSTVISENLLEEVRRASKTSKLSDVLDAVITIHAQHTVKPSSNASTPSSAPLPPRADMSASVLRYDAYQAPKRSARRNHEYIDEFEEDGESD
ncbi:uncharacterized protein I303_101471 [Kwoniella dejecticola CBS 10117]|uniref:Clathrin/coatomer adaptor adaptin-like N-terminal domain-containing protein n=1 Tax=Kwoniella dejecticola CBS 10117 TaxID=1296121 RepID=A0AAJ8ME36_9TREE